ncbi:tyrosine-type recombinase/integrase [Sphingomonas prati]|uniref:Integrase n=1 Tax=Sphingomonas prati TaxID=1843237 RepID=A0A7W9F0E5_9SPHN|nr:integrase arm-type DNA-binding domain-containing protein [Sphingomonas prati]MBB5728297.1 integrase [Sphingomonas prati]GGE74934.1 integrase [Sphingomonas prati]
MLNDAKIKAAKPREKPYKLTDSNQLYLHVTPTGGRHWRMNYTYGVGASGKPAQKTLTFGPYPALTLVEARKRRDVAKDLLRDGRDPAVERRIAAKARTLSDGNTFERIARQWYEANVPRWSTHHASDVITSLARDVFPQLGNLPLSVITASKVLEVLKKIEDRDAVETAKRLRQRMSAVFVYAIASGIAENDPAAIVRGALKPIVLRGRQPAITDLTGVRQVLIDAEAERSRTVTKFALRFLALTAVRPGELRGAAWDEMEDLEPRFAVKAGERVQINAPLWRIPGARMKGEKARKAETGGDHLVPLSHQAVEVLDVLRRLTGTGPLCFPNERHVRKPMSENAIGYLLNRAGYHHRHVPHGWRAAFSTIMNEWAKHSGNPDDRAVIDLMLAHVPKDKVESAYNRAAFMPRRRELAQTWADMLVADMWPPEVHLGQPIRYSIGNPKPLAN